MWHGPARRLAPLTDTETAPRPGSAQRRHPVLQPRLETRPAAENRHDDDETTETINIKEVMVGETREA